MLAEQLKEKGSRKEGDREADREIDSAAQGMLLAQVGTCTW